MTVADAGRTLTLTLWKLSSGRAQLMAGYFWPAVATCRSQSLDVTLKHPPEIKGWPCMLVLLVNALGHSLKVPKHLLPKPIPTP